MFHEGKSLFYYLEQSILTNLVLEGNLGSIYYLKQFALVQFSPL
jgi:hypothetical protein